MIFTLDKQIWFKIATPCLVANYENSHKMTFQTSMGIVQRIHQTQKTKYNVENLNCAFRVYVVLKGGGVLIFPYFCVHVLHNPFLRKLNGFWYILSYRTLTLIIL